MDDEDDENDQDFNPCHVSNVKNDQFCGVKSIFLNKISFIQDTLSDIEVNEDDEMAESDPEIEEEKGTHKKSGAAHQR